MIAMNSQVFTENIPFLIATIRDLWCGNTMMGRPATIGPLFCGEQAAARVRALREGWGGVVLDGTMVHSSHACKSRQQVS